MILSGLAYAVIKVIDVMTTLIFVRAIISWFPINASEGGIMNKIIIILNALTDPILKPVQFLLFKTPLRNFPVDFSPIAAYVGLIVLRWVLVIIYRIFI